MEVITVQQPIPNKLPEKIIDLLQLFDVNIPELNRNNLLFDSEYTRSIVDLYEEDEYDKTHIETLLEFKLIDKDDFSNNQVELDLSTLLNNFIKLQIIKLPFITIEYACINEETNTCFEILTGSNYLCLQSSTINNMIEEIAEQMIKNKPIVNDSLAISHTFELSLHQSNFDKNTLDIGAKLSKQHLSSLTKEAGTIAAKKGSSDQIFRSFY